MLPIKLAFKELTGAPRFVLFFLLNVAIGLSGLIILENFKLTFNENLHTRSKNLLGADLSVGGRRPVPLDKRQGIAKMIQAEQAIYLRSMFSMVRGQKRSKLVNLQEYHRDFPFYGGLLLRSGKVSPGATLADHEVWVYPELLFQLKLKVGQQLQIGEASFVIADVIEQDSSQTFQMGSIAPKILITKKGIEDAKLVRKGSTAYFSSYYKTALKVSPELVNDINEYLDDNALSVTTPDKASQQVGRVINYLTDFLGLVSLVALFLAIIGIFYLYRSYLASKRLTFAIMKSIGLSSREILISQFWNLIFLATLGTLGGVVISFFGLPLVKTMIDSVIPLNLQMDLKMEALLMGVVIGLLGVLLVGLPLVFGSLKERASNLFLEAVDSTGTLTPFNFLRFLPLLLFYVALSIWVSHSVKTGLLFVGIFVFIAALFFPLLSYLLKRSETKIKFKNLEFTLSLRYLARYRLSSISIFLSLFFGAMLINFIPTLQESIQKELDGGLKGVAPSLFLFDIQEEQVDGVKKYIQESKQTLLGLSPMIRSRLTMVNGKPFKVESKKALTREGQREQRFRNRGINLSYRMKLNDEENIIEGGPLKPFKGEGIPEVSLEYRYADRMGLNMGDVLTFDIMGIEQEAKVANLRRVKWTSFRPNFFISFTSGVLEDAPKTFLAAVPAMGAQEKVEFQTGLVEKFPNVSAVDLDRVVAKIKEVMGQMSVALSVMSFVVVMVGMMVVFALVNHQINERKKDLVLLKVLGLGLPRLRKLVLSEFFFLSFFSSLLGSMVGLVLAFLFSRILFEGLWAINPLVPLFTVAGITGLCLVVSQLASYRTLKEKAAPFL